MAKPVYDRQLTAREVEALQLAADGLSYKQAGSLIGLSPWYVKRTRWEAIQKLGADNIVQAVAMAIRRGIIQ